MTQAVISATDLQKERGWTQSTLVAGAQHIGVSPALIGLLPRGSAELVEVHQDLLVASVQC